MTTVTLENNRLSVAGHAGYDNVGYDIVCAREKPNNNTTTKKLAGFIRPTSFIFCIKFNLL